MHGLIVRQECESNGSPNYTGAIQYSWLYIGVKPMNIMKVDTVFEINVYFSGIVYFTF